MIAQRNGLLCEVFVIDLSSGGPIYIVKSLKTTVINVLLQIDLSVVGQLLSWHALAHLVLVMPLTPSCIMLENGQTYFKNLVV